MTIENVPQGIKRNRTRMLAGGVRARARRPGETDEQIQKWKDSILKRSGNSAVVFPSQAFLDEFFEDIKRNRRYQALVGRVMSKYIAGELVERPKVINV